MENAEAGPSHSQPPPYPPARPRPLPTTTYYTLEYPGLLRSPASLPAAIHTLGGQDALDAAFRRNSSVRPIELSFRPGEPFAHPVTGEVSDFRGVVVKVVKRKRKRRGEDKEGEDEGGVYTTEALGVARKVARFRAMADFSFAPQEPNRIIDLRRAMDRLDAKAITSFEFLPEKEDYILYPPGSSHEPEPSTPGAKSSLDPSPMPVSNMRVLPPPRFSRAPVPLRYDFRQNPSAYAVSFVDESTGEERTRFQNRWRHTISRITSIAFDDEAGVPQVEPEGAEKELDPMALAVLVRIRALFEQRPVWSRLAMRNQLTESEDHIMLNARAMYTYTGYTFSDGPWRDCHVRFGYDPRTTQDSRFYQRMQFRNLENDYGRRSAKRLLKSLDPTAEDVEEQSDWRGISVHRNRLLTRAHRNSHIFDGKVLHRHIGIYQLCDMPDPLLQGIIQDPAVVSPECTAMHGWYTRVAWERLRAIARRKFGALLEGRVLPDSECADLLTDELPAARELKERGRVSRPKGHNLAMEPAAPEEEAEVRLRRRLE
ncbi:hypothetical protein CALVIDRAFT_496565, partial [Calocera viscosa TUFC12733]